MPIAKPMLTITPAATAADANTAAMRPTPDADQPPTAAIKKYGHTDADIDQQISDWLEAQRQPKQP